VKTINSVDFLSFAEINFATAKLTSTVNANPARQFSDSPKPRVSTSLSALNVNLALRLEDKV
jgi:hypothetical protein